MTTVDHVERPLRSFAGIKLAGFQKVIVWLAFATTFAVLIEPAPCDVLFCLAIICFAWSGLSFTPTITPLILVLILYNVGALLSYAFVVPDDTKALLFVITGFYMSASAVFLAAYVSIDSVKRIDLIRNALIIGGVVATVFALAGYLRLFGFEGGSELYHIKQEKYQRAVGLFKDPNVYSTYIVLPAVFLVQGIMLGTQRYLIISILSLVFMLGGLLLAFSRGAWVNFLSAAFLLVLITYILTESAQLRRRIVLFLVSGVLFTTVMLMALLSIEKVRFLFLDRFTLVKSYDAGETGRFANQINSIPMLLERPFGFGPLRFTDYFYYQPHNTYINAFCSYGWLGGIVYFVFITLTLIVGIKAISMRTPWQHYSIAVFCPMFATMFQGIQIDTDHWRHFYWMIGLMWGLFAASVQYQKAAD